MLKYLNISAYVKNEIIIFFQIKILLMEIHAASGYTLSCLSREVDAIGPL